MISIQDTTETLSAADLAALRTHQAGLSYRILVTAAGSRAELDAAKMIDVEPTSGEEQNGPR